jgi:hypothetical protein
LCFHFYITENQPADIGVQLSEVGNVEFSYSGYQTSGISPLCGCYSEQSWDTWRGVTFPARYLQINREGKSDYPFTSYIMTAATPHQIRWYPSIFRLQATAYTFSLPINESFDPRMFLNEQIPKFPESYKIVALLQKS